MKSILDEILSSLKKSKNLVIISVILFLIAFLLGVFLTLNEEIFEIHKSHLFSYYTKIFCEEKLGIKILFTRIINSALILLLVALLSLNKYTFYLIFVVLFYRGFILGLACKLFISELLVLGAITFAFLVLIQAVFITISIIVFISLTYKKVEKIDNCAINLVIKSYITSLIIAILGCAIEFIFILTLFRPLNFYF